MFKGNKFNVCLLVLFILFNKLASAQWTPAWIDTSYKSDTKLIVDLNSIAYRFSVADSGAVITKYDVAGSTIWAKFLPDGSNVYGTTAVPFSDSLIYLVTVSCNLMPCIWKLFQLDSTGSIINSVVIDSSLSLPNNLWTDSLGNVYLCYTRYGMLPIDSAVWIAKFDSTLLPIYNERIMPVVANIKPNCVTDNSTNAYLSTPNLSSIYKFNYLSGMIIDTLNLASYNGSYQSITYMDWIENDLFITGDRKNVFNKNTGFITKFSNGDTIAWSTNYQDSSSIENSMITVFKMYGKVFGLGVYDFQDIVFIRIDDASGNKEKTKIIKYGIDASFLRTKNIVVRNDKFYFVGGNILPLGSGNNSFIQGCDSAGNAFNVYGFNLWDSHSVYSWAEQPNGGIYVLTHAYDYSNATQENLCYYFNPSTVASVFNVDVSEEILVVPNPAVDEVEIKLPSVLCKPAQIEIMDLIGKKHIVGFTYNSTSNTVKCNINELKAGCYVMIIKSGKDVYYTKMVKQNF